MTELTLQHVEAFRVIYALGDIVQRKGPDGKHVVNVSHYTCVLEGGRYPLWGIFSARTNRLVGLRGSRAQIESEFPTKVWRRKHAQWELSRVVDPLPFEERSKLIHKQVRS